MDDESDLWADPQIRRDYEAALGSFILAFNEVDFRLTAMVARFARKIAGDELVKQFTEGDFPRRVANLRLLQAVASEPNLRAIDCDKLMSLNGERNVLAHGHFDQNPFDGSYVVQNRKKVAEYPIGRVVALAEQLIVQASSLRKLDILFDFDDLTEDSDTD